MLLVKCQREILSEATDLFYSGVMMMLTNKRGFCTTVQSVNTRFFKV